MLCHRTRGGRGNFDRFTNRVAFMPLLGGLAVIFCCLGISVHAAERPNIVWIMAEDIGPELSCYGHPAVRTPNIDALAADGVRFTRAFTTAPSCTPSRNAMMLGVYQTRTDTQDQRRRGVVLPPHIKPITYYLQQAGYFTALGCGYSNKTDLNFKWPHLFDANDWKERRPGQPFFAQITLWVTHRQPNGWAKDWIEVRRRSSHPVDPAEVALPPYFPDHPECRLDWARYLDAIEYIDAEVGEILDRLEHEGLADNTIVIFCGDNGRCHLRSKCWLYEGGIHVPLIIRRPGQSGGIVRDELVSMLDVSASVLEFAGIDIPDHFDGRPLWGPRARPRDCIFAARDLIDTLEDHIRCVRTDRFKYIRNYNPELGYRESEYVEENRPMLPVIRRLAAEGKLNAAQQLLLAERKPDEELYDLQADPFELHNLADSPEYREVLDDLRARLDRWIEETGDTGLARLKKAPEPTRTD
ncbi:sulfatase [Thermostilla marina]